MSKKKYIKIDNMEERTLGNKVVQAGVMRIDLTGLGTDGVALYNTMKEGYSYKFMSVGGIVSYGDCVSKTNNIAYVSGYVVDVNSDELIVRKVWKISYVNSYVIGEYEDVVFSLEEYYRGWVTQLGSGVKIDTGVLSAPDDNLQDRFGHIMTLNSGEVAVMRHSGLGSTYDLSGQRTSDFNLGFRAQVSLQLSNGNIFIGGYDGNWCIVTQKMVVVHSGVTSGLGRITALVELHSGRIFASGEGGLWSIISDGGTEYRSGELTEKSTVVGSFVESDGNILSITWVGY